MVLKDRSIDSGSTTDNGKYEYIHSLYQVDYYLRNVPITFFNNTSYAKDRESKYAIFIYLSFVLIS